MAYVAVNKDRSEVVFNQKPRKEKKEELVPIYFPKMKGQKCPVKLNRWSRELMETGFWAEEVEIAYEAEYDGRIESFTEDRFQYGCTLPKGSIKKLIGRELTWTDDPVELK